MWSQSGLFRLAAKFSGDLIGSSPAGLWVPSARVEKKKSEKRRSKVKNRFELRPLFCFHLSLFSNSGINPESVEIVFSGFFVIFGFSRNFWISDFEIR